jgi:hypothetical protein
MCPYRCPQVQFIEKSAGDGKDFSTIEEVRA